MKRFAAFALLVTLALPASAQNTTFDQLLTGKDTPLTVKLKDLNGDWRRISVGSLDKSKGGLGDLLGPLMQLGAMGDKNKKKDDTANTMLGMQFLSSMFGGGGKDPVYYTKGLTVLMGGETFLIAYIYHKPTVDLLKLAADSDKNGGKDPDFAKMMSEGKMTADSALTLTLINTKTIGTMSDIRPFDMNTEIAESVGGDGGLMDLMALGAKDKGKEGDASKDKDLFADSSLKVLPTVKTALLNNAQLASKQNSILVDANNDTNILTIKGYVTSETQKQKASAVVKKALADMGSDMVVHNNLIVRAASRK